MGLAEIIIAIVIVLQTWSFLRNLRLMWKYGSIFSGKYDTRRSLETGQIIVETGKSNDTFMRIITSINEYLNANSGRIIDYGLLKDAVNRNCDSLEDEISTQMPVPLYLGLCGTMGGVIIGLWDLISSGSIIGLLSGNYDPTLSTAVAEGVDSLLNGVALAMCASVWGIFCTIINTLIFKKSKKEEEKGKNKFLSWMQAKLLPVLPSSMSNAMTEMVRNLNEFNRTFSEKVDEMADTLSQVNEVYRSQEEILSELRQMDVEAMSSANARTLKALTICLRRFEVCSDNIEKFGNYIEKIDEFTEKLNREMHRLEVLEGINVSMNEIKEFYRRHKAEIAQDTTDSQDALDEALKNLREVTEKSVNEMQKHLVEQTDKLTKAIDEYNDIFVKKSNEMQAEFAKQLEQTPEIGKKLEEISNIPAAMNALGQKIDNLTKAVEENKGYVSKPSDDTRWKRGSNSNNSKTTDKGNSKDEQKGPSTPYRRTTYQTTTPKQIVDKKLVGNESDNEEKEPEEKKPKAVFEKIGGWVKSIFSKKDKNSEK